MIVAIVGSRNLIINDLRSFLPSNTTEIVSGGARGIDSCAREYAHRNGIAYTEFKPDYERYKRGAPIVRNRKIAEYSDQVIALWDGESKGTKYVIDYCKQIGKNIIVHIL